MTEQEHVVNELARAFAGAIDKRLRNGLPGLPPNLRSQAARRKRLRREARNQPNPNPRG